MSPKDSHKYYKSVKCMNFLCNKTCVEVSMTDLWLSIHHNVHWYLIWYGLLLHEVFLTLIIRAPRWVGHRCIQDLGDEERVAYRVMGFNWFLGMPYIWVNHRLQTDLIERWHIEYNTFHLSTREVMITLEDVYQILWVPSHGDAIRMIML